MLAGFHYLLTMRETETIVTQNVSVLSVQFVCDYKNQGRDKEFDKNSLIFSSSSRFTL